VRTVVGERQVLEDQLVVGADLRAVMRPPRCDDAACCRASNALQSAVSRWQGRRMYRRPSYAHADAVWRAVRELRGEPPSMEGWLLW
jgi:hypothetical protein